MNPVKVITGFIPFVVFAALSAWLPVTAAAAGAFVAAVIVVAVSAHGGVKMLPAAQAVILGLIAASGLIGGPPVDTWLTTWGQGSMSVTLGLFIIVTATFYPFSAQTARGSVPRQFWHTPQFIGLNRRISTAWGLAILACGVAHLTATATATAGPVIGLGVPVIALFLAYQYTKREVADSMKLQAAHQGGLGRATGQA